MKNNDFNEAFNMLFGPLVERKVNEVLSLRAETTPAIKDPEQFLSINQAAKEFGCSSSLLSRAMNNLELEYYQPENRTYIKRVDVFNYLESIKIRSKDNIQDYSFLKNNS